MEQMKTYERQYWKEGFVCGIDEVGRGPLAGPVVACAVVLPRDWNVLYVNDSKKLSAKKREELYDQILATAISVGIGFRDERRIDEINILQATYEAMQEAVANLSVTPSVFLNDAVTIPGIKGKQIPIVKGDGKSASIAAASIVAKVTRDRIMVQMDTLYPGYGFADNKGYGSPAHIDGIARLGLCPIHRKSFTENFV
jgi:ribonuclease HII